MEERRFVVEREFEHCGLRCVVVFQDMGHRCGYVGVREDHPLYGACYGTDEIDILDVHGGITYASDGRGQYPIESDIFWWFGFNCAHYGDLGDHTTSLRYFPHLREQIMVRMRVDEQYKYEFGSIRTLEYVENQCKLLAEQLFEYEKCGKLPESV